MNEDMTRKDALRFAADYLEREHPDIAGLLRDIAANHYGRPKNEDDADQSLKVRDKMLARIAKGETSEQAARWAERYWGKSVKTWRNILIFRGRDDLKKRLADKVRLQNETA